MPLAPRLTLITILLVAFALRAHHLTFESLWSDEGISLQRAAEPLRAMLAAMPVEHAPGYFVALRGWLALAGSSDYALRFLSLLGSVLAVALLQRVSSDLARPRAVRRWIGLLSAALLATNAFQVAYAQEGRMYSWLLAMSLLATLALWQLLYPQPRAHKWAPIGWGALYAFAIAACVYLHYFGALVAITQTLFVLGWVIATRRLQLALRWTLAAASGLVLFAPWLPRALGVFGFAGWREGGSTAEIPWRYLAAYSGSNPMPAPWDSVIPWLTLALALLGAVWWVRIRPAGGLLASAMALLPFAGVLLLAMRNPDYHERYTIFISGPLMALAAAGTIALEPRVWARDAVKRRINGMPVGTAALAAILIGANFAALAGLYGNTAFHKPDYRAAAQRIQAEQRAGDLILIDGPDPERVFSRYYNGGLPVVDLRDLAGEPSEVVDMRLHDDTQGAERVWELLYFHDPAAVQVWLATHSWPTEPTYHNNIRLTLYGMADEADSAQRTVTRPDPPLAFGDALTLERATIAPTTLQQGDVLRVTTDWLTHAPPPDWKFSLRLHDAQGNQVQAADYIPQNWFAPTSAWSVGHMARDLHGLATGELAPGAYTVTLRLYDAATGAAVATDQGEDVALGTVEVLP